MPAPVADDLDQYEWEDTGVAEGCGCGATPDSGLVFPEVDHGHAGFLALLFGITAAPKAVKLRCFRCRKVVARSTDPRLLRKHHN